jgi:hypothetical protein
MENYKETIFTYIGIENMVSLRHKENWQKCWFLYIGFTFAGKLGIVAITRVT